MNLKVSNSNANDSKRMEDLFEPSSRFYDVESSVAVTRGASGGGTEIKVESGEEGEEREW